MPTGTLTKKTRRQPRVGPPSAIRAPPTSGPTAVATPTTVPIAPNARPRSAPVNICWTRPETCGLIRPPASPCSTRAAISSAGPGGEPGHGAGHDEAGDPDQEHPPPPVVVAQPAGDDRDQPEGEGVAGDDPLQLGRSRVRRVADGGQRDVGHADVEQRHEECADADAERSPAGSGRLGHRARVCRGAPAYAVGRSAGRGPRVDARDPARRLGSSRARRVAVSGRPRRRPVPPDLPGWWPRRWLGGRLGSGPADLGPATAARGPEPDLSARLVLLVVQVVGSGVAGRHQPQARPLDARRLPAARARARWPGSSCAAGRSWSARWRSRRRRPTSAWATRSARWWLPPACRCSPPWPAGAAGAPGSSRPGLRRTAGDRAAQRPSGQRSAGRSPSRVWLVLLLVVGEAPRYRAEQFAAARRARAAETRVAASAERLALARDLHDTIGHSLSMIAVQAGVALHLLDEHPEQARPALTAIRTASKEALEEVRATLSILREEDFEGRPAPGLARVGDLVAAARVGGLTVTISPDPLEDSASGLPDDVDAAAFRVVQEGLTNVARHSAAAHATVAVVRSPGRSGGQRRRRRARDRPGGRGRRTTRDARARGRARRPRRGRPGRRVAASGSPYGFRWTTDRVSRDHGRRRR